MRRAYDANGASAVRAAPTAVLMSPRRAITAASAASAAVARR
jgi:hypothetical protein